MTDQNPTKEDPKTPQTHSSPSGGDHKTGDDQKKNDHQGDKNTSSK
jgi:hypothetical protein